jgi:ArsR family transcriptional regulator, arsenate/arsenite/antimonite-responsive transcriptional repressor
MKTTAYLFKALSKPVRLRIPTLLTGGERCICDLMAVLDLPQSTVSRHLSALRNTGWVKGREDQAKLAAYLATKDNTACGNTAGRQ